MDFVNSDYLRSGLQFVRPNYENTSKYKGKYTRLENFYNMGLKNMAIKTPLAPTQKDPPISLDTKSLNKDYREYNNVDIKHSLDIIADCEACKRGFYKRRAEKKELKNNA